MKDKITIIVVAGASFMASFATSALNLSVPDMGEYFHMGATSVSWIVTLYILIMAAFSVPAGKIADSTSRRNIFILGLAGYFVFSIASLFAWNAASILIFRGTQGVFGAMMFATNIPLAISAYPPGHSGKAIGVAIASIYTGLAAGPVLGGFLNTHFTFKGIFFFSAVISGVFLTMGLIKIPKEQEKEKARLKDIRGNILFILMISSLIYGLTGINSIKNAWIFLIIAAVLAVLFYITEKRAEEPIIDMSVFRDKIYTLSNITALLNYTATYALTYVLSIYFQVVRGYTSQTAGLIIIAEPVLMALLSTKMGNLSDRTSPYKLVSAGMAMCAATLFFFALAQPDTPIPLIVFMLAFAGVGFAMFSSPNTNIVMSCIDPSKQSVANAVLSTMRTTGQCFALAIITMVTSVTVGNISLYQAGPESLMRMMHISFIIFTVCSVAGVIMSLQRRSTAKQPE